jgi:hypothetical protein
VVHTLTFLSRIYVCPVTVLSCLTLPLRSAFAIFPSFLPFPTVCREYRSRCSLRSRLGSRYARYLMSYVTERVWSIKHTILSNPCAPCPIPAHPILFYHSYPSCSTGYWNSLDELRAIYRSGKQWDPQSEPAERELLVRNRIQQNRTELSTAAAE